MNLERYRRFYNLKTSLKLLAVGVALEVAAFLLAPNGIAIVFFVAGGVSMFLANLVADLRHTKPEE